MFVTVVRGSNEVRKSALLPKKADIGARRRQVRYGLNNRISMSFDCQGILRIARHMRRNKPTGAGNDGTRVSLGCLRLTSEDVTDLYSRVSVGTKVIVLPMTDRRADLGRTIGYADSILTIRNGPSIFMDRFPLRSSSRQCPVASPSPPL